jgi:hypothetical protein
MMLRTEKGALIAKSPDETTEAIACFTCGAQPEYGEQHDFAVVLAKRETLEGPRYYLLKTAYCLRSHTIRKFAKERDAYWAAQKD